LTGWRERIIVGRTIEFYILLMSGGFGSKAELEHLVQTEGQGAEMTLHSAGTAKVPDKLDSQMGWPR
jgi:hypothetical protein